MKTFIKKTILLLFLTLFLILIFRYNNIVTYSSINALKLWVTKLFPSLFIMFILNDIIINTNSCYYLNKLLSPLFNKLFYLSGESSLAFILSIFSGTPANGFIIKEMLSKKKISEDDANKLMMFTFFSNPLFLYNILSMTFNTNTVIKIIFITYVSNFIVAFLVRRKRNSYIHNELIQTDNIFKILEQSIKKSINTMFMILGTVTFFMILSNILISTFNTHGIFNILLRGTLEITSALNELASINAYVIIKEIIALTIISFGGFSIHMQIYSIISESIINYKYFLKGRIMHVIISILITISTYCISIIIS